MFEPALPQGFIKQLLPLLGNEADAFFASYQQQPLRGIRFRDERIPLPASVLSGKLPYARNAYYLDSASDAGSMPLHEAGAYYIQEPSAMAAAAVLAPQDGDIVLDLCAAPGGKSTQLAGAARLKLLVANEPIPSRAQVLSRNIERMGIGNAVVTCAYPLIKYWWTRLVPARACSGGIRKHAPNGRRMRLSAAICVSWKSFVQPPKCCGKAEGWFSAPVLSTVKRTKKRFSHFSPSIRILNWFLSR